MSQFDSGVSSHVNKSFKSLRRGPLSRENSFSGISRQKSQEKPRTYETARRDTKQTSEFL
jgi:hypothetical protein